MFPTKSLLATAILALPAVHGCIVYMASEVQYHGHLNNGTITPSGMSSPVCSFDGTLDGSPEADGYFHYTCIAGYSAIQEQNTGVVQYTCPRSQSDHSRNFTATNVATAAQEHMFAWEACAGRCGSCDDLCPFPGLQ